MDDNTLIIVIVFAVVYAVVYVADVFKYRQLAGAIAPIVEALKAQADRALAPYGDQLKPAHDVFTAALTLIDQDSDALSKVLPESARRLLLAVLNDAQAITDGEAVPLGVPPQEHIPAGTPNEAVK